jgi:Kef-type K+ transport system membrane component KefB
MLTGQILLQLIVILLVVGHLSGRIGQQWVIGEILAGLALLIVLNIGFQLGILSPTLFTMLVIMAICTTMMASPLLPLLGYRSDAINREDIDQIPTDSDLCPLGYKSLAIHSE